MKLGAMLKQELCSNRPWLHRPGAGGRAWHPAAAFLALMRYHAGATLHLWGAWNGRLWRQGDIRLTWGERPLLTQSGH